MTTQQHYLCTYVALLHSTTCISVCFQSSSSVICTYLCSSIIITYTAALYFSYIIVLHLFCSSIMHIYTTTRYLLALYLVICTSSLHFITQQHYNCTACRQLYDFCMHWSIYSSIALSYKLNYTYLHSSITFSYRAASHLRKLHSSIIYTYLQSGVTQTYTTRLHLVTQWAYT